MLLYGEGKEMDYRKETILTIEDEEIIRDSFRYYLEDHGYKVLEAEDGRAGLEIIRNKHPDLVLLDLRMPEMGGLEVLEQLKHDAPDLPVIVISGTGFIGDVAEAMKCGACNYLLKPVADFDIMRYAVEQALEKKSLVEENRRLRQEIARLQALHS
jgi:DNA-binding NtrC family response regulator